MSTLVAEDCETELLESYRAGDNSAGWKLVLAHEGAIDRAVEGCRWFRVDEQELKQELFVRLLRAVKNYYDPNACKLAAFICMELKRTNGVARRLSGYPLGYREAQKIRFFRLTSTMEDELEQKVNVLYPALADAWSIAQDTLDPIEFRCFQMLLLGWEQKRMIALLRSEFRTQFKLLNGKYRDRLDAVIKSVIQRVSCGQRTLENTYFHPQVDEAVVREIACLLADSDCGARILQRKLASKGIFLHLSTISQLLKDFEMRQCLTAAQDKFQAVEQLMGEWRARKGIQNLPSADDSRIPDSLYESIKAILPDDRKYQNEQWRENINAVAYRLRHGCTHKEQPFITPAMCNFCFTTLRKLGVLEKVSKLIEEHYGA